MKPRHLAVAAGLALTLSFGAAHAATPVYAEEASVEHDANAAAQPEGSSSAGADTTGTGDVAADDVAAEPLPAPSDYDKTDFCEDVAPASARSARSSASSLSSVSVSSEMKYFTKYESHSNYRQGFGRGDGYNALGYYQFDRRYSLISFVTAVYSANPAKYSMLKPVIDRGSEIAGASSMYDSEAGTLNELGQLAQNAWYAAYDTDPAEFSAFQDAYAYNSYYVPTERWLKSELGIDMFGRADCVKGMVWGLSNMWGTNGVKKVMCGASLSNDMTDREFVTALATQMTDNIAQYSSQTRYYKGWGDRYRNELNDCLAYISLHEAEQDVGGAVDDPSAGSDATGPGASDSNGDAADEPTQGEGIDGAGSSSGASGEGGASDGAGAGSDSGQTAGDSSDAADPGTAGGGSADEPDGGASSDGSADAGADGAGSDDSDGAGSDTSADGSQGSEDSTVDSGSDAGSGSDTEGGTDSDGADAVDPVTPQSAPSTPGGSVDSGQADNSNGSDAESDATADGSAEGDSSEGDTSNDASGQGTSAADEDTQGDGGGKAPGDDAAKKTGADGERDGAADPANASDPSGSDGGNGSSKSSTNGAKRLPQTSDLALFAGLAGASAATFGATFVFAGKSGIIKRKDGSDSAE
ncbi:hypothetical protein [Collinsella sp. An307]|uniref:VgrG-related protein n=1 Tax=Collinsella sp. An307 TaxID=1965630 RepID=UPI000B38B58D|nr:hypothetical protein [Collinsella sp. An307]OUO21803.1 hypothetical protein B5F89_02885 [Collinsella sp. An307]